MESLRSFSKSCQFKDNINLYPYDANAQKGYNKSTWVNIHNVLT
jgi:hypothetical protein